MKNMKVLIITGGNVDRLFLEQQIDFSKYNWIIGVDGGLNILYDINKSPDAMIGDFDSVDKKVLHHYKNIGVAIIEFPPEKDITDTQIAIEYAISQGANEIDIVGATGSRLDHTLANIFILGKYIGIVRCRIIDRNNLIEVFEGKQKIKMSKAQYKYLSLIPLSKEVEGVTTNGFKYELTDATLKRYESLGVSNEMLGDYCSVCFNEGVLAIIYSND